MLYVFTVARNACTILATKPLRIPRKTGRIILKVNLMKTFFSFVD